MRVDFDNRPEKPAKQSSVEREIAVIKFGAAALGDEAALHQASSEIYRRVREGDRVVAVVPVSETDAARLLAAHCDAVGLDARVLDDDGKSSGNRAEFLRQAVAGCDVAIVPGVVAANEDRPKAPSPKKCRIAIAGLGLIGEGAALRLGGDPDYDFCAALVREPFKERAQIAVDQVTNDLAAFLAVKPDVVIDALPDGGAGRALIKAALERGVSVATANKQAIAGAMHDLTALAEQSGAAFAYSASVGGGAPFVETVIRARNAGEVASIEAVLNGTVNFILTSLAQGARFEDAVKAAQQAGFAEPDPTADLSGADARAKLAILSYAAFGREIDLDKIDVEPLDSDRSARIAKEGGQWRQFSRLEKSKDGALKASVAFKRMDEDPLFSRALWEANALRVRLSGGRAFECRGKGAGRRPTVESIFGDLDAMRRAGFATPQNSFALARGAVPA